MRISSVSHNFTNGISKMAKVGMLALAMIPASQMLSAQDKDTFQSSDNSKVLVASAVTSGSSSAPVTKPKELSATKPQTDPPIWESSQSLSTDQLVKETSDYYFYSIPVVEIMPKTNKISLGTCVSVNKVKFKDPSINNGESIYRLAFEPTDEYDNNSLTRTHTCAYLGNSQQLILKQINKFFLDGSNMDKVAVTAKSGEGYIRYNVSIPTALLTDDAKKNVSTKNNEFVNEITYQKLIKTSDGVQSVKISKEEFENGVKELVGSTPYAAFTEFDNIVSM